MKGRKGNTSYAAFHCSKAKVILSKLSFGEIDGDCTVCKNGLERGTDKMDK